MSLCGTVTYVGIGFADASAQVVISPSYAGAAVGAVRHDWPSFSIFAPGYMKPVVPLRAKNNESQFSTVIGTAWLVLECPVISLAMLWTL
jgi:hypothetical protein